VLTVAAVVSFLLLRRYGGQGAQIQLDAIRTAGTLVIGTGGAVALLLTARRQRYTELTLVHTDRDATERRITELYTKAAELLGSGQVSVRMAGLYALERLAHSTVEHRQSIVDVICVHLRMPYTPPRSYRSPGPARRRRARTLTDRPPHATPTYQGSRQENAQQEQQVRLTARYILLRNLRVAAQRRQHWWHRTPPPAAPAWPGMRLTLAGALLPDFSLAECQLGNANFTGAQFTGVAYFMGAQFTGVADFAEAQFTGMAYFMGAQFTGVAYFGDAQFTSGVDFGDTRIASAAGPDFGDARVASTAGPGSVWPPGWTTRPAKPDNGEDPAFLYLTRVEEAQSLVLDPGRATPISSKLWVRKG